MWWWIDCVVGGVGGNGNSPAPMPTTAAGGGLNVVGSVAAVIDSPTRGRNHSFFRCILNKALVVVRTGRG